MEQGIIYMVPVMRSTEETPEELLATAIIKQAVKDYVFILRRMWQKGLTLKEKRTLLLRKNELESFFFSGWYETLTDLNPDVLIRSCKRMAMEQEKARIHRMNQRVLTAQREAV